VLDIYKLQVGNLRGKIVFCNSYVRHTTRQWSNNGVCRDNEAGLSLLPYWTIVQGPAAPLTMGSGNQTGCPAGRDDNLMWCARRRMINHNGTTQDDTGPQGRESDTSPLHQRRTSGDSDGLSQACFRFHKFICVGSSANTTIIPFLSLMLVYYDLLLDPHCFHGFFWKS
jgi:hypothetical protein